tara:strand:+ start:1202 stop:3001 length:1800 start_codon:yes stop_codon:yes gene_type:complete
MDALQISGMKCGIFKGRSYHNYGPSVLKSGVCKYFRRGIFDKFRWCVVEMLIFGMAPDSTGKGLVTNITNRLKILVMEEIVFCDIGDIVVSIEVLNKLSKEENIENKIKLSLEFCSVVEQFKRARLVSYVNNWWKFKSNVSINNVTISKVNKYAKKNDSEELLQYGELFIEFLESKDERIFAIYNKLYSLEGKFGSRNRRSDAIYLLFDIVKDRFYSDPNFKVVYDFGMEMFNRKQMTERRSFGVWMLLFIWKWDELCFEKTKVTKIVVVEDILKCHKKIAINEDFVVGDYHVNKKFGLAKFGSVGAYVKDECLDILGENGVLYRNYYLEKKGSIVPEPEPDNVSKRYKFTKKPIVDESKLKVIKLDAFENLEVMEAGVCGLKVCCLSVVYNGKPKILKEMRESFRFGRDYMMLDVLKNEFGITNLGMSRVKLDKILDRIDKSKKTLVDNWKWIDKEGVYCMMDKFENVGDIGKHKHFLEKDDVFKNTLKIRLFDGLFRSSDNILRNILVSDIGEVVSIDEGDIFGKRAKVFNKSDWFIKKENIEKTKEFSKDIISKWKLEEKIDIVIKQLDNFKYDSYMKDEVKTRFVNYGDIIATEL